VAKVMEGGKVQDINLEESNLGLGDSGSSPETTDDALEYIAG
jgi:hypothetical protein